MVGYEALRTFRCRYHEYDKHLPDDNEQHGESKVPFEAEAVEIHGPLSDSEREQAEREAREQRYREHDQAFKDRQTVIAEGQLTTNKRLAGFTLVLVVLGLVGNLISWMAASAARVSADAAKSAAETAANTLVEIQRGSSDTHAVAEAAGKQADATKAQAEDTNLLANEARRSSEIAGQTLEILQFQQRAWVAPAANPKLEPAGNGLLWSLRNYGNSPAFRVRSKGVPVAKETEIAATQDTICSEIEDSKFIEVLFPGQIGRAQAAFVAGSAILRVAGCIRYADQFSTSRWTRFCYEPDARDPSNFISCLGFNTTDTSHSEGK
jgi:hypothetical protein